MTFDCKTCNERFDSDAPLEEVECLKCGSKEVEPIDESDDSDESEDEPAAAQP